MIKSKIAIGNLSFLNLKKNAELGFIIEGIVSMEISKRDFDICPPSAFKIDQYMQNPQVWYNHDLWSDGKGNYIPIGKTLELHRITLEEFSATD